MDFFFKFQKGWNLFINIATVYWPHVRTDKNKAILSIAAKKLTYEEIQTDNWTNISIFREKIGRGKDWKTGKKERKSAI